MDKIDKSCLQKLFWIILAIISIILYIIFPSNEFGFALAGAYLLMLGVNLFRNHKNYNQMIFACIVILAGSFLLTVLNTASLGEFEEKFDMINSFTLGSFALIIATFAYPKEELEKMAVYGSVAAIAFLLAGFAIAAPILFPASHNQQGVKSIQDDVKTLFLILRVPLIMLGLINFVFGSVEIFNGLDKKIKNRKENVRKTRKIQ